MATRRAALREAAAKCRSCDLYREATQTVFGEGRARAAVMLVGETPGDREDIEGHPFVGPAGKLLDKAMAAAGIPRGDILLRPCARRITRSVSALLRERAAS